MKELTLSVYTNQEGGTSKVTMNAIFDNHTDAVAFHDGVADLCKRHSAPAPYNRVRAGLLSWSKPAVLNE